jgi:ABC-type uncharacterized transport system auxiliary subunit
MRRRTLLLALAVSGCGLSERPYEERRSWPILVPRPASLPARTGGKVLELRTLRAGPGLEVRGLQVLRADGSVHVDFYEEWAVPPAQGVEDAMRRWLGESGLFAAVVAPGSRATADLIVEGELSALWCEPAAGMAHAALTIVVMTQSELNPRVLLQRRLTATAALSGQDPAAQVQAQLAALTIVLADAEAALRPLALRR